MFKISYQTFGCKLNFAETISISGEVPTDKKVEGIKQLFGIK